MKQLLSTLFMGFVLSTAVQATPSAKDNLLIFNTQEFRPFTYMEGNRVSGPATEIVTRICQQAQIECRINLMGWPDALQEAKDGKVNGLFVIGWNEKRGQWLYYSLPVIRGEYGFFTNQALSIEPRTLNGYADHNVGVYGPSNLASSLEKIQKAMPTMQISMFKDDTFAFEKLSEGTLDSVYSNRDVGYALIGDLGLTNLRYSMTQKPLNYYIGFVKKSTSRKLANRFNRALKLIYNSGEAQAILERFQLESIMQPASPQTNTLSQN